MEITEKDLMDKFEKMKQEILVMIPSIVISHIQDQHKYKKLSDSFYKTYPELKKEKALIGSLANKIAAENPELSMEEVFKKTGKRARKILGDNNEKL